MNRKAYLATGRMIAMLQGFSKLRVNVHGKEHIPEGPVVFVVNHFTRIETVLLPYHIYRLTKIPVWSLADASLFAGPLGRFLDLMGAVSTKNPDRDRVIVKTLLTGEASWIIFPEGRMVKDKELFKKHLLLPPSGVRPRSGAATLALRTEFYRQRMLRLQGVAPEEVARLQGMFQIPDLGPLKKVKCHIVPVNITYYPLRARENALSRLTELFLGEAPLHLKEEILTEGSMLLSGVDIDIRFGSPIDPSAYLTSRGVEADIVSTASYGFDDNLPSLSEMKHAANRLMQRYMSSIYSLTTVNHDHLFASLLRAYPFKAIDEDDFRRRVFLLTKLCLRDTACRLHQSLSTDQVSLLTDDRYHKYREFRELALEKGVVVQKDGELVKDRAKFSAPFEMQRARIDNPIGVIANEVLPLTPLQREVHLMAWLPVWLVRKKVAQILETQALEEFDADYRTYFREGESKESEVGMPVLLKGTSRRLGVVLVHGLLSVPAQMLELARYLQGKGLWVYLVRLKGHGTSPEDLALRNGNDWVASVDLGYALMKALCDRVVVGGFSFGGGVALDCASRVGDAAGVFAVCPPQRLLDISSRFAPAVTVWNRVMDVFSYQWAKKEFVESVPERPELNYTRIPVSALRAMERFMSELEPKLAGIRTPVLVLQSEGDPVVDPRGSQRLFEMLGSEHKSYRRFPLKRHGILAGAGSEEVHAAVGAFLDAMPGARGVGEGPQQG
ncbi:alpha/beta fold hydrolase [Geomonas sp. Red69]|uniref:alpha/beta fold hydrolase n=1 Tax=Geomonas diazotrophica TaxID=2843197 RepID=UPI001C0FB020|nr:MULTISPECIES: alpha/beta fold hydrolase [Geomonas]MBU5636675.1 alpha/beta fold hydrolase [Geomonas diazotrophica]QXE87689.1 alpha/beta fold hydrolase [Geomonas nitrogeniifigens]